ncbi:hypothetical protein HDU97_008490 [Phlyctochytrium planicorne]|nr:hypothetical protein HDU97_008490 [Phlyctochytrium planicorne]
MALSRSNSENNLHTSTGSLGDSYRHLATQERVTSFSTLEGAYILRDEIRLENGQPSPYIGTFINLLTIKSHEVAGAKGSTATPIKIPQRAADPYANEAFSPNMRTSMSSPSPTSMFASLTIPHGATSSTTSSQQGDNASENGDKASIFSNKGKLKAKKPSISKPSFVSRIVAHEQLAKFLIYKPPDQTYLFYNNGRAFVWGDYSCSIQGSENLFLVGYDNGTIYIFDKDKEDLAPNFTLPPHDGDLPITAMAFSPDCVHLAVTSMDGKLRIIDHALERVLDIYSSYFGGLNCVSWSPDGKFIATGGQDDLVTVWSFRGKVVARCQGHSSWVNGVAFDPYNCTERSYRFGSVGEDTRLCLWDFSVSSLHRPKVPGTLRRNRTDAEKVNTFDIVHPVQSKREVAVLEPFMATSIHNEPLNSVTFREDAVITTDRMGGIKVWLRPSDDRDEALM